MSNYPLMVPSGSVPAQGLYLGSDGLMAAPVTPANPIPVSATAKTYTATNIALTANQIAGTDPIIAANANRRGLMFSSSGDFRLALASGQAAGMPIYSSARDSLIGSECPLGALYMASGSGFATGTVLTVWEA